MNKWLRMAAEKDIVIRALKLSCIVGTLLIGINYGDAVFTTGVPYPAWWKILLTYCVPYLVSTYSAVSARLVD
jgi:hypothetical protein